MFKYPSWTSKHSSKKPQKLFFYKSSNRKHLYHQLQPLTTICSYLGILPFHTINNFTSNKLYLLFLASTMLIACLHFVISELRWSDELPLSTICLDHIMMLASTSSTLLLLFRCSSRNLSKFQELFRAFDVIDTLTGPIDEIRHLKVTFVLLTIVQVSLTIFYYYFSYLATGGSHEYLNEMIQWLYIYQVTILQIYLLHAINLRQKSIGRKLHGNVVNVMTQMRTVLWLHQLIETYNSIFGPHTVLTLLFIYVYILNTLDYVLLNLDTVDVGPFTILLIVYLLATSSCFVWKCELIEREGKLLEKQTLATLWRFHEQPKSCKTWSILLGQVTALRPKIEASGLFRVNAKFAFTALNLLVGYVTVVLYFVDLRLPGHKL